MELKVVGGSWKHFFHLGPDLLSAAPTFSQTIEHS